MVIKALSFLVVLLVVAFAVTSLMMRWMAHHPTALETRRLMRLHQLPPAPRLQANPAADMAAWRAQEDRQLQTYGWIDRAHGIVHVPIERAMALVIHEERK